MDAAELNDIKYSKTPTGFVLEASLSSFWSIPMIAVLLLLTGFIVWSVWKGDEEIQVTFLIGAIILSLLVLSVFWWIVLLRTSGSQSVIFDTPQLEVGVGLGSLRFKYHFDVRDIRSIAEGDGIISGGEGTPPYKAIVIDFIKPVSSQIANPNRFAFGHFLTKGQKTFIINRLREAIGSAA